MPRTAYRAGYSNLPVIDFSGGWNPRDAWSEVEDNELTDVMNFTLDKKGGLVKRLGLTRLNSGDQITNANNVKLLYYSAAIDKLIAQIDADLYTSSDGGVTWGASIKNFSTTARIGITDFLGKVVFIHPVDAVFHYDGATVTGPVANSPDGSAIAVWQNFLWSIGDPAQPSRVTRSDPGAITWPASPVTNDVRVKDDQALTAIGGGEGMDVLGRAGLLVFKENSTYRLHDVTNAAYTVVDYNFGASGPLCVTTNNGMTAAISRRGIIVMRGDESVPILASYKIEPLFHSSQLTFSQSSNMAAGNVEDRMVFSLPWDGSNTNNLTLEYHPNLQWIVPHDFGCTAFTSYTKNTRKLFGGKVGTGASTFGYVFDVFTGGSDDGANITCRAQTKWFEPNGGSSTRFRRAVINGRGDFNLYVKRDYDTGQGEGFPISIQGTGAVWGSAVWGIDTWATTIAQDYQEIFSLGVARSISFEVQETSSNTFSGVPFLDVGASETQGGVSLYGIIADMVTLGRS